MPSLIEILKQLKHIKHPTILEVKTIKGKGHLESSKDKVGLYHSYYPNNTNSGYSWSQIASDILLELKKEHDFNLIISAMQLGTKLDIFLDKYPNTAIDVGISEEAAATMAAALSKDNKK